MLLKKFNKTEMEKKEVKDISFDIKAVSENGVIEGYGSVSGNIDSYDDIVMPGAFKKTLNENKQAKRKLPMLWQHKQDEPIGYWFDTKEDDNGLYMRGQLDLNVNKAREAYSLMKNEVITGLSIGFIPISADFNNKGQREIYEVKLMEVSVVTFPANDKARVTNVKQEFKQIMDELEEIDQGKLLGYAQALKDSASNTSLDVDEPSARQTITIQFDEKSEEDIMKVAKVTLDVPYEDIKELESFVEKLQSDGVYSKSGGHHDDQADNDVEPHDDLNLAEWHQKFDELLAEYGIQHSTSQNNNDE